MAVSRAVTEALGGTGADAPADGAADSPSVRVRVEVPGSDQMRALGARLAELLRQGDLVVLSGSLGAGKTTLVQGIGAGLGVRGPVTSPTFVIARVHPSLRAGPDLVHADAYRLGSRLEVDDLDLDADLDHSVTVVEWGEGLVENLAPDHLWIAIDWAPTETGAAGEADGGGESVGTGEAGGASEAGGAGDEPRLVTAAGFGERWRDQADVLREALQHDYGLPSVDTAEHRP